MEIEITEVLIGMEFAGKIIAGIIVVALVGLGASYALANNNAGSGFLVSGNPGNSGNSIQSSVPDTGNVGNVADGNPNEGEDPFFGSPDAAVTIIEYSDFQCPYCARAVPVLNQIKSTYGNAVRIVYKDFPLGFHQFAQKAAEAGQCANEQGRFWELHDIMFANQGSLDVASIKGYASSLGLDTNQFNSCLDSGKYASEVQQDVNSGKAAGVSGTPTFFVNGKKIVGAQPFSEFKKIIDAELDGVRLSGADGSCDPNKCDDVNDCIAQGCEALTGGSCGCQG